jgi:hypothetical protein
MAEKLKLTTVAPTPGIIFRFDCATYQDGFPEMFPIEQVQVIDSMGVDFDRQRFNRRNYKPFRVNALAGDTNYATALTTATNLRTKHGWVVKIEYTNAGVLYVPATTYFLSIDSITPRAGTFLGGLITPAAAFVEANFTLKGTGIAPV